MSGNLPVYPPTVPASFAEEVRDLDPDIDRNSTPPPFLESYVADEIVWRDVNSPPPYLECMNVDPAHAGNFDADFEMAMEIINADMALFDEDPLAEWFVRRAPSEEVDMVMDMDEELEEEEEENASESMEMEDGDELRDVTPDAEELEPVQMGGSTLEEDAATDPEIKDAEEDNEVVPPASAEPPELDIRDMYEYEEQPAEARTWQKILSRRTFRMTFRDHPDVVDGDELLAAAILDLTSRVNPSDAENLYMGLELNWDGAEKPWGIPYKPVEAYRTSFLRSEFALRSQSARSDGPITGPLSITFTWIDRMRGSGLRPTMAVVAEQMAEEPDNVVPLAASNSRSVRWRNVTPNKCSELCLGIAMLQALQHFRAKQRNRSLRSDLRWKALTRVTDSNYRTNRIIREEARRLLRAAGITRDRDFTVDDVKLLQSHYRQQYQIVLINNDHSSVPVYMGPFVASDKVITLLCTDNHYAYVKSLHKFLGKPFFCTLCQTSTNRGRSHYTCPLRCRKCLREGCVTTGPASIRCANCPIAFTNMDCFNAHVQPGPRNGASRCEETRFCYKCGGVYYTDKGYVHICNMHYCKVCATRKGANHVCTMRERPYNPEKIHEKRIFFDLEVLHVNSLNISILISLCLDNYRAAKRDRTALRCCRHCRDTIPNNRAEALTLECPSCSPDGKRLWEFDEIRQGSSDVMNEFGDWLIHERHMDFVLIAHNLKGFDGQFVLQHLFKQGKPTPDCIVMDGSKLNFASVAGIRILDSYNFVPFGLAAFSKAFDIPTIVKGDFPVLFIDQANYGYQGPMPDRRFYPASTASKAKRDKFDEFYTEQLARNHVFCFDEIFDYCYADVALLAAAMTKFEQSFMENAGVMLFEEAVTAASAAVLTYTRNHLPPDSLVLDMAVNGKGINQSVVGARYLLWRSFQENLFIQTGMHHLGEYQIPNTRFHVDGYIIPCAKYPRGLAIEVKGCYWHAHSCCYKCDDVFRDNMTAADIRNRDADREAQIMNHCELEVVWECEIASLRKGPVIAAEALAGGRTEPFRLIDDVHTDTTKMLKYKDFTSLYPYCMKYGSYMVGASKKIPGGDLTWPLTAPGSLEAQVRGIVSCNVLAPGNIIIPVLPYRHEGKLLFAVCRTCVEEGASSDVECEHDTAEQRSFRGTYTTLELELALEMGYKIGEIYGALHWDEWRTYSKDAAGNVTHSIFSSYVDTFLKLKQEACGYPPGVTTEAQKDAYIDAYFENEGIRLDKNNIRLDAVLRQIAKLLLNSLWGKLGQRTDRPESHIIDSGEALQKLLENPTIALKSVTVVSDAKVVVVMSKVPECVEPLRTSAMPYAVYTTSIARVHLYRTLQKIPEPEINLLYMDTDSVIYKCLKTADPLPCGDYLGQLTDELDAKSEMMSFVTTGPKSYAYLEKKEDQTTEVHLKTKGFPKTEDSERQITMALMERQVRQLLRGEDTTTATVTYQKINRDRHHRLYNREEKKDFKFTFNKRLIMADGGRLPIGFY